MLIFVSDEQAENGWIPTRHTPDKKHKKKYTVKQWKKFEKKGAEKYDQQMYLLKLYNVILTDYRVKRKYRVMCPTPLKEKIKVGLKNLPSKLTAGNLDKGLKTFDKGMKEFDKQMASFSKEMGSATNDLNKVSKRKNNGTRNVEILMGKKKNHTPIWSEKKPKKKRKSRSDNWDKHEKNLEKIWGKKK